MVTELIGLFAIAIIQGMTEWLPISSSGHLVLFEKLLNLDNSLEFNVALHFGTLMAVLVYFFSDIFRIVKDIFLWNWESDDAKLGFLVVIATIPAGLVGYLLKDFFEIAFSSLWIVALGFAITGVFLFIASFQIDATEKNYSKFGYGKAFLVGIAQIFALFPGISRSGVTIGGGLLLGLNEKNALKFSFLMAIPIIFGSSILTFNSYRISFSLILAVLVSFFSGLLTIYFLSNKIFTSRKNLKWFGIYVLILALVLGVFLMLKKI